MNLYNYNWNALILGMLRQITVHTVNIGWTTDYKSERFIIENDDGGNVWLDKELGTNVYKLNFGFFVGSNGFTIDYSIYCDSNEMKIEFHGKR